MPWSALPTPYGDRGAAPAQLPELLDKVLAGLGAPTTATILAVYERWPEVVGAEMVAHATPVAIEDGCLRLSVDSPAWASHLRWSEAEILARLAALVGPGTITSVRARVARP